MWQWQDIVNGLFESCGGFFILFSCVLLYKQKKVRGVSPVHISYFTLWGFWNPYYYTFLKQQVSFFGCVFVVAVNLFWLVLLIHYIRKEKYGS